VSLAYLSFYYLKIKLLDMPVSKILTDLKDKIFLLYTLTKYCYFLSLQIILL